MQFVFMGGFLSSQNCIVMSVLDTVHFSESIMVRKWIEILFNQLFF